MWKTYLRTWPGEPVARCTIERRMKALGLAGMPNARTTRTTRPARAQACPADRLERDLSRLVHHSDRGCQYVSIRYTERLLESGIEPSVGSTGDSYDNAAAEALNKLYKKELIWKRGPWSGLDAVELATMEWVDWYNNDRLHSHCGDIPPIEYKDLFYAVHAPAPAPAGSAQPALR